MSEVKGSKDEKSGCGYTELTRGGLLKSEK